MVFRTIKIDHNKVAGNYGDFPVLISPFNLFPNQGSDEMTILLDEKGRRVKQVVDGDNCWVTVPMVRHDSDTVIMAVSGSRTSLLWLRTRLAFRRLIGRPAWARV